MIFFKQNTIELIYIKFNFAVLSKYQIEQYIKDNIFILQ